MIFIRHAEPDKDGNLTENGIKAAALKPLPRGIYFTSNLARSKQTMEAMGQRVYQVNPLLNEWDKDKETAYEFKKRVLICLKELPDDAVIIGHARFMNWAYFILTGNAALGFDYLEGFEA